jgi:ribosomal protein L32
MQASALQMQASALQMQASALQMQCGDGDRDNRVCACIFYSKNRGHVYSSART